jgi:hypothetical protein
MEEVKLAEVISRVIQAVLGDLIPVTEYYRMARLFPFGKSETPTSVGVTTPGFR